MKLLQIDPRFLPRPANSNGRDRGQRCASRRPNTSIALVVVSK